jgi:hypothetical protein
MSDNNINLVVSMNDDEANRLIRLFTRWERWHHAEFPEINLPDKFHEIMNTLADAVVKNGGEV